MIICEVLKEKGIFLESKDYIKNFFKDSMFMDEMKCGSWRNCKVLFKPRSIHVYGVVPSINMKKENNTIIRINKMNDLILFIENIRFTFFNSVYDKRDKIIQYYTCINDNILKEAEKGVKTINNYIDNVQDNCKELVRGFYNYFLNDILLQYNVYLGFEYILSLQDKYVDRMILLNDTEIYEANKFLNWYRNVYNSICSIINKDFSKFTKVIGRYFSLDKELHLCLVWELIKQEAVPYFSQMWEKEYGDYFKDVISETTEAIVRTYCIINELETKDANNIGKFTYYLMKYNKFENSMYSNFRNCNKMICDLITMECENLELENYEKRLINQANMNIKYTIDDVDLMTGFEFEDFVGKLFKKMGFSVQVTKSSGDQGVDVLAEKRGNRVGIQAKCYSSNVGNKAIQEVVAGMMFYKCSKGIVVTNNFFTKSAIKLAEVNNIVLWDRNMLTQKIEDVMNK